MKLKEMIKACQDMKEKFVRKLKNEMKKRNKEQFVRKLKKKLVRT